MNNVLLTRTACRADPRQTHIAVDALDGALRLALPGATRPFGLLGLISSVTLDEPPAFAIAVARRLGVIYLYMPENSARSAARDTLKILAEHPEARSDALHQLGISWLVDGLEANRADDAEETLRKARKTLTAATDVDNERIDAELYATAIDGVLALVDRLPAESVRAAADQVTELALMRAAWRAPGRLDTWLGDTYAAEQEWRAVTAAFAQACEEFDQLYWTDASRSLTAIARAHRASTVARILPHSAPGLRAVVEPRFSSAFVSSQYRMGLLNKWAEDMRSNPDLTEEVSSLLGVIDAPKGKHADAISELRSQAKDPELVDSVIAGLRAHEQRILERRLETFDGEDSVLEKPASRRVTQDIRAALEGSPDYFGPTRMLFDRIVDITIRYVVSRIDVEPGFAKGRFRFLADPGAIERELQLDYWDYLTSTSIGGIVGVESPHIGGGRVDVRFSVGGTRIVAELKRDEDPVEYGRV